jgi:hypothetical protein
MKAINRGTDHRQAVPSEGIDKFVRKGGFAHTVDAIDGDSDRVRAFQ